MRINLVLSVLARVLQLELAILFIPLAVAFFYGESTSPYLLTMGLLALSSLIFMLRPKSNKALRPKDGFAAVALSWVAISFFGAFPFYFSGLQLSFIDAFFEAVSGFTTTGATIFTTMAQVPRGLIFWRGLTQFIGGMGILLFMMTMTASSASGVNMLKGESTGPTASKLLPRIRETARLLYRIYFTLTGLLALLLWFCGFPLFDAIFTAMCTAGTGGFGYRDLGLAAYNSPLAEGIIALFMFLFGINFTLYFYLMRRKVRDFWADEEFRLYLGLTLAAILLITPNIFTLYGSWSTALRHSAFQVTGVISTTGYATANYANWPAFSKAILLLLTLCGGCAGSTGGGLKVIRILLVFKNIKSEVGKLLHPRIVRTNRLQGRNVPDDAMKATLMYFSLYALFFICFSVILALENPDFEGVLAAVLAIISNVGPGLGSMGPLGNFSLFSNIAKITLSFGMFATRLEFYPVLLLFAPSLWHWDD
ncbi:MAG: TrkH family potassium uptake protein [Symbiobacteriaceae bacterium]|nr:TrkH family potassium uptake protein [Symbiobacteriaceae bacterium]